MKILITGGAGFIGSNTAKRFIDSGNDVIVFDNLSRKGSKSNLEWLKKSGNLSFIEGDLRNYELVKSIFSENENIDLLVKEQIIKIDINNIKKARLDLIKFKEKIKN